MNSGEHTIDKLLALIPQALPLEVLENYGLRVSISQAEALSVTIVSLTMFWIKEALGRGITSDYGKKIWGEMKSGLAREWEKKFGFDSQTPFEFLHAMHETHSEWEKIMIPGMGPVTLFSYAANQLETLGILQVEEHQHAFALFLDFVPVEEIDQVICSIEQGWC